MENKFVYKPYRIAGIFAVVMAIFVLVEFLILAVLADDFYSNIKSFGFLAMQFLILNFALLLFSISKKTITFEEKGLTVVNDQRTKSRFIEWSNIRYAYYKRSYKGHVYLVLSADELNRDQVKKLVSKGANFSKICFDNALVIYLDFTSKHKAKINSIVKQNVEEDKIFLEIC